MYKKLIIVVMLLICGFLYGCDPNKDSKTLGGLCNQNFEQDACLDSTNWYTTKWEYNLNKFDGKDMTINIYVDILSANDPNRIDYSGDRKAERVEQQKKIEAAYGIEIQYLEYPEDAAYGISRIEWINKQYKNDKTSGNIYLVDSYWLKTLSDGDSIAPLSYVGSESSEDLFSKINYKQHESFNTLTTVANRIYGYAYGYVKPDTFLYYNQDLVNDLGIADPATLWNQGNWDYETFVQYINNAQALLSESQYAFGGDYTTVIEGMASSHGYGLISPTYDSSSVLIDSQNIKDLVTKLRAIYHDEKAWEKWASDSLSSEFVAGDVLFTSGNMWFYQSDMRFNPLGFEVSAVPYPTRTGDGTKKEFFKVPLSNEQVWTVKNLENGANGLNSEILLNILDDLNRGFAPESANAYEARLKSLIKNDQSVAAILSVQKASTILELVDGADFLISYNFKGDYLRSFTMTTKNLITSPGINVEVALGQLADAYRQAIEGWSK